jgi:hypothetical protein
MDLLAQTSLQSLNGPSPKETLAGTGTTSDGENFVRSTREVEKGFLQPVAGVIITATPRCQTIPENHSTDIIANGKPCPDLVNTDGIIAIQFGCPHSINNLVLSPIEIVQIPAEETIEIVSSLCISKKADLDSVV